VKSFFKKNKKIYAFTLVELVVSIAITSILFMFLFSFVVNSLNEIEDSKRKTDFFSDFSSFNVKMKNFSEAFPKYSKIQDFNS
jgi:prepilin-type N-terminal cleavage/methylation domain-containing protein